MKRFLILSVLILFAACAGPTPIAPSPVPSIAPSLVPSIAPTSMPLPDKTQMPALEKTIDLSASNLDQYYSIHPIALDDRANRLYVSASFSRTVVLDADTLASIGEIPFGGSVSVYPEADRLYVGVQGNWGYDGGQSYPAELKVFDASTLAFRRSVVFSDTSITAPYAVPDPTTGKVYIVHAGVYIADANSLEVSSILSGTMPTPGGLVPNFAAVDAAIDPARRRLFVSLNNGIPGSNNGNGLSVYNLSTGQLINQDGERSVSGIAVDPQSGRAYVPRSYMSSAAIVKYDSEGRKIARLDSPAGDVQIDPARDRVYVLSWWVQPRLVVLDSDLNYLGETRIDVNPDSLTSYFDPQRDRLYVLSRGGRLNVLLGHASSAAQPSSPAPARGAVQWIVPSPVIANDHLLYAAFGAEQYVNGYGALFRSDDDGASWEFIAGLPVTNTTASLAFSPDYANDQTLFVSFASGAASGGSGVYRSVDGGRTWQPSSHGLTDLAIQHVVVSPDYTHDHTVFASGVKAGLFRSTDGGRTWASLADRYMLPSEAYALPSLSAFAVSPHFAQDTSLILSRYGGNGGVFVSRDRGETWKQVIADTAGQLAYASRPTTNTIFAALGSSTLVRSDDGGEHWVASGAGLDALAGLYVNALVTTLHPEPNYTALTLFTGYDQNSRLYSTFDGDQPWEKTVDTPSLTAIALKHFDTQGFGLALYLGTADGYVRRMPLSDLGVTAPTAKPINTQQVQSIAIGRREQRNEIFAGGGLFGVWASTDLRQWPDTDFPDRHIANPTQIVLSPDYVRDATLFATAGHGLYRSRDAGHTWETLTIQPGTGLWPIGSVAISPNFAADRTLLVAGDYRQPMIMTSNDGGDNWTAVSTPFEITRTVTMRLTITPDNLWWTWIDYYGLYRSENLGQTWSQVITHSETLMQSIAFSPDYLSDGTMWIGLLYGQILKTTNAGRTWQTLSGGELADKVWIKTIAFSPDYAHDRLVFVGTDKGLLRTVNEGRTWTKIDTGLPPADDGLITIDAISVSPAFADDRTLLVSTIGSGLFISRDAGNSWTTP